MSEIIAAKNAPAAIGPYSQAVRTGNLIFTSGQIAIHPETGKVEFKTIEEQTRQVCENLSVILKAAGSSLDKVVKTVCYLRNMDDFSKFNSAYEEYFTKKPARSCVAVRELPKNVLVEIDAISEI